MSSGQVISVYELLNTSLHGIMFLYSEAAKLWSASLLKTRLRQGYFSGVFKKILRTSFSERTFGQQQSVLTCLVHAQEYVDWTKSWILDYTNLWSFYSENSGSSNLEVFCSQSAILLKTTWWKMFPVSFANSFRTTIIICFDFYEIFWNFKILQEKTEINVHIY